MEVFLGRAAAIASVRLTNTSFGVFGLDRAVAERKTGVSLFPSSFIVEFLSGMHHVCILEISTLYDTECWTKRRMAQDFKTRQSY